MTYSCERCGYITERKGDLRKHLNRQTVCDPILKDVPVEELLENLCKKKDTNSYVCEYCERSFGSPQSKYNHKQKCKYQDAFVSNKELQKRIELLEKKLEENASGKTTNITNTNNGVIHNNHITINAVGKEDISYILELPNFQKFMTTCIRSKEDGLIEYLEAKHFDHKHPENHNIRKLKRDGFIEQYDGTRWKLRMKDQVLDDVFHHMQTDFANFIEEAFGENGDLKRVYIDNFMRAVGEPLNWDLSAGDYEYNFDDPMNDEKKQRLKEEIYRLAIEHIYIKSKEHFNNAHNKKNTSTEARIIMPQDPS